MNATFEDRAVEDVFAQYPAGLRRKLLQLRTLILKTAHQTEGVGELVETLKWGQPSYLPKRPRVGSTVRLGPLDEKRYALFFHCQTTLVESFRVEHGPALSYEGNRALVFELGAKLPSEAVKQCIQAALTYHLK